ncbi:MAG TPA: ferrous iron transport protein B, partial [Oscillospiraceae bacterium]|nr:ferrous iron transport protein B [Oscillospiraceae bacterium]
YNVVDLPGTYSLGAFTEDEIVARDFILRGNPDVVINVIDSTNIERNLYLTTQLLEMGVKVIVVLNMIDEAESKNIRLGVKTLSKKLGAPVVTTVASKKRGIDELIRQTVKLMDVEENLGPHISYGDEIDKEIENIKGFLSDKVLEYPPEWIAIKLVEGDQYIHDLIKKDEVSSSDSGFRNILSDIEKKGEDYELEIVNKRYEFVKDVTKVSVIRPREVVKTITDKLDSILIHKYWGFPIFVLIMFVLFQLTFVIGEDLLGELMVTGMDALGHAIEVFLININSPGWVIAFTTEGLIGGLGAIMEFIPLIVVLYMLMGILEDSGYMARAAYIMDNIMRKLGLQGKTFISMIVGFGCNVPGIMATRTLESRRDRMIAILINPFMSCGAKLLIYLVFIAAFFPNNGGLVLFIIYFIGILVALIMGKIFSKTLFKGETTDFIMELPPYRKPVPGNVLRNMWDNVYGFLKRAGTVIFAVVIVLWILAVLPVGVEPYGAESILGKIGLFTAPIFKPAGFGTWQAAVGLFSGIAAKEAVVTTLGMVYAGVGEGTKLISAIQEAFTPLTSISFMIMTLLYTPCAATLAIIKKETNSVKWAIFAAIYTFVIGWAMAVLVFQVGSLLGFN